MGYHNAEIHAIFQDKFSGQDLEFAEIKTTNNQKGQYTINLSDFNVKFFIFYNYIKNEGLICYTHSLLRFINPKTHSGIYHHIVKSKAIFISKSLNELKKFYDNEILFFKKLKYKSL